MSEDGIKAALKIPEDPPFSEDSPPTWRYLVNRLMVAGQQLSGSSGSSG